MINRNTRVVIVDDVPSDVAKLIDYLNKEGIPINYFDGSVEKLPQQPLKGIRILFLDLVLVPGQVTPPMIKSMFVSTLSKIVARDNGPYVIVAWTKHVEEITGVKQTIGTEPSFPKPIAIINMDKTTCMDNTSLIRKRIRRIVNSKDIMTVLFDWEADVHEASSDVLQLLQCKTMQNSTIPDFDEYSKKSRIEIEKLFCALVQAYDGHLDEESVLLRAQIPLTNILNDNLETKIRKFKKNSSIPNKILSHRGNATTAFPNSELNKIFLLEESSVGNDNTLRPGNIYAYRSIRTLMSKSRCGFPTAKWATNTGIIKRIMGEEDESDKFYKKNRIRLNNKSIPITLDITPPCDYAKPKMTAARFLLGILLPLRPGENDKKYIPKRETAYYPKPPLAVGYNNNEYYLVLTNKIFSIDVGTFSQKYAPVPILRARRELLVDVLNWIGRSISRPGRIGFE